MIYLDYAAATPMDEAVLKSMQPYFTEKFYNPSANYLPAKRIKEEITEAKKSIASQLGAKHSEIIHTSGGTESNNLAIAGVMERFPGKKILVSAVEHDAVINPAGKYGAHQIPVDKYGAVDKDAFKKLLSKDVVMVSVMLANNEVGTIQPIKEIADIIENERKNRLNKKIELPIYLHTDACQAPCYLDVHASRLGVDLMTLNGGKIYGPKGSGILFVKSGVQLSPQILGGGQQRGIRSGTENPASLIGFAKALDIAVEKREAERARIEKLRGDFIKGIMAISPDIEINGHPKKHVPHILNATFPGIDNERLLFQLEDEGVLAASGSACSASSEEPSHVLGAMDISDIAARRSIRFSFGRATGGSEINETIKALRKFVS